MWAQQQQQQQLRSPHAARPLQTSCRVHHREDPHNRACLWLTWCLPTLLHCWRPRRAHMCVASSQVCVDVGWLSVHVGEWVPPNVFELLASQAHIHVCSFSAGVCVCGGGGLCGAHCEWPTFSLCFALIPTGHLLCSCWLAHVCTTTMAICKRVWQE